MKLHPRVPLLVLLALLFMSSTNSPAQPKKSAGAGRGRGNAQPELATGERRRSSPRSHRQDRHSQHSATIQGKEIKYTATAGKLVMKSDEGEPKANFF